MSNENRDLPRPDSVQVVRGTEETRITAGDGYRDSERIVERPFLRISQRWAPEAVTLVLVGLGAFALGALLIASVLAEGGLQAPTWAAAVLEWGVLLGFVVGGPAVAYWGAAHAVNSTHVEVGIERLSVSHAPMPWCFPAPELRAHEVQRVLLSRPDDDSRLRLTARLVDGEHTLLMKPRDHDTGRYIGHTLAEFLEVPFEDQTRP